MSPSPKGVWRFLSKIKELCEGPHICGNLSAVYALYWIRNAVSMAAKNGKILFWSC